MEVGYRDRMIFQYFYPSLSLHLISIKLGTRERREWGAGAKRFSFCSSWISDMTLWVPNTFASNIMIFSKYKLKKGTHAKLKKGNPSIVVVLYFTFKENYHTLNRVVIF